MWDKIKNIVFVVVAQILIVFSLWMYFKSSYGFYKHKYISQLENDKTEFKEHLNALETESIKIDKVIKVKAKKLKSYAIKSEIQRKKVDRNIDTTTITDDELECFLSRYPDPPEPP